MSIEIDLGSAQLLSHVGAAADVFSIEGKAVKIFRSQEHPRWGANDLPEDTVRAVFESERAAWELVQTNVSLRQHTPQYLGVGRAIGLPNLSQYLVDCCIIMSRIDSEDESKLFVGGRPPSEPYLLELVRTFTGCGIGFVHDASVFDRSGPDAFKVIDFAVEDVLSMPPS